MSAPWVSGVLGIGLDIVETHRLRKVVDRYGDRFLSRVFCSSERAYCERNRTPWRHYAGRFAVKEAVSKAFGTGIGAQVRWKDIEVVRNVNTGAPSVCLLGSARAMAKRRGVTQIRISIAHGHAYAVGQALLIGIERDTPEGERTL